jgi:hypothetical protein
VALMVCAGTPSAVMASCGDYVQTRTMARRLGLQSDRPSHGHAQSQEQAKSNVEPVTPQPDDGPNCERREQAPHQPGPQIRLAEARDPACQLTSKITFLPGVRSDRIFEMEFPLLAGYPQSIDRPPR